MLDPVFKEIARLTATLFDTPLALVSLVDEDSIWFKAHFGVEWTPHVSRSESVCSVTIFQDATTVFEDLRCEPRPLPDPTVIDALGLRSYAGHPLRTSAGFPIGVLCVMSRQPRTFSFAERTRLQSLAGMVMKLLELRETLNDTPEPAPAMWTRQYHHIDEALLRLQTMADLARQEASASTPAARRYLRFVDEEIRLITQALVDQLQFSKGAPGAAIA